MTKTEWLKLLRDKNLIWNDEAFTLTEQDKADGLTSVDEKIDLEFVGDFGENFAEIKEGRKEIVIMKGQEGINEYVTDKIQYLDSDELVNIIRQMPGGLRSVLETAWNWKLQEDGEYTMSIATTASLNVPKLLRLADLLDKKGLFIEANEIDNLIVAHCGHCDSDKKKKKKKKAAQLVLAMIKKALKANPSIGGKLVDDYFRNFLSSASVFGLTEEQVKTFIGKHQGQSLENVIKEIEVNGDPVSEAFIEILSISGAVID